MDRDKEEKLNQWLDLGMVPGIVGELLEERNHWMMVAKSKMNLEKDKCWSCVNYAGGEMHGLCTVGSFTMEGSNEICPLVADESFAKPYEYKRYCETGETYWAPVTARFPEEE